jgi:hypothetical protein
MREYGGGGLAGGGGVLILSHYRVLCVDPHEL